MSKRAIDVKPNGDVRFYCPACECNHRINIVAGRNMPVWQLEGSHEEPTIYPSVKVTYDHWVPPAEIGKPKEPQTLVSDICHTQITNGSIFYYLDSTHAKAGDTIKMLPFDDNQ